MTFEKEFPLAFRNCITENPEDCYEEDNPMLNCEIGLEKSSLIKHCLSKQKVKEIKNNIIEHIKLRDIPKEKQQLIIDIIEMKFKGSNL